MNSYLHSLMVDPQAIKSPEMSLNASQSHHMYRKEPMETPKRPSGIKLLSSDYKTRGKNMKKPHLSYHKKRLSVYSSVCSGKPSNNNIPT